MGLALIINGSHETLGGVSAGATLAEAVVALELKADRVAIECNGEIAPRDSWSSLILQGDERLEIVHFVGGGCHSRFT